MFVTYVRFAGAAPQISGHFLQEGPQSPCVVWPVDDGHSNSWRVVILAFHLAIVDRAEIQE
jgi:hypothetical protein